MRQIGVCSWSLKPTGPADLVQKVRACGLDAVQLALDPIRRGEWDERETEETLRTAGISVLSGMMGMKAEDYSTLESIKRTGGVRMDETWDENLAAARRNAEIASRLRLQLVTFHAGFLPNDSRDPERETLLERLRRVAGSFSHRGVRVALETGQESADTLRSVLDDLQHPHISVNFDPANMILYGMGDPVAALAKLGGKVSQVHIKDAVPASTAGEWGQEVPVGTGRVDWPRFFRALKQADPKGNLSLIIEREAGKDRVEDVRTAKALIERLARD